MSNGGFFLGVLIALALDRVLPGRDADILGVSMLLIAIWLRYRTLRGR